MVPMWEIWISAAARNRIQIRREQSIKDNTTNNYKRRDISKMPQQIKLPLFPLVNAIHEGLWPDRMHQG